MSFRSQLKSLLGIQGVAWQHPLVYAGLQAIRPVDHVLRRLYGTAALPSYPARVRSNGISMDLGARAFERNGIVIAETLQQYAGLIPESHVLEIGCGSGRTAHALAGYLQREPFVGMDIDQPSIEACQRNERLQACGFTFDWMDVQNDEYNPEGQCPASEYRFPYETATFDVIFLVSVFTHMLTPDVENYIREIGRMLTPGGHCLCTTFLIQPDYQRLGLTFQHSVGEAYVRNPEFPEVAVGYPLGFFEGAFAAAGMKATRPPLYGEWRGTVEPAPVTRFPQDMLVYRKPAA